MYSCYICGTVFAEPSVHFYVEDMDGEQHYQPFYVPVCPRCGSEDIYEIEEGKYKNGYDD